MNKLYRYYSQNGEDYLLNRFFDHKNRGFFIEVGAFDGIHLSNTYCFELIGWKGICIEPQSWYFNECKKNRPESICINAACTDNDDGPKMVIETDETGLFSGASIDINQKNIQGHYATINKKVPPTKHETVDSTTLDKLLDKHLPNNIDIDFISIDVEGIELKVLHGLNLHKYRPRVLVIETNTDDNRDAISKYLSMFHYEFARKVGPNSFFTTNKTDTNKINDIEITCTIEKQIHPRGREYTQSLYLEGKILFNGMNGNLLLQQYKTLESDLSERKEKVQYLLEIIDNKDAHLLELRNLINQLKKEKKQLHTRIDRHLKEIKKQEDFLIERKSTLGKLSKSIYKKNQNLQKLCEALKEREETINLLSEKLNYINDHPMKFLLSRLLNQKNK